MTATGDEIREVSDIAGLTAVGDLLQQVWGTPNPVVPLELMRAIAHSGGYVAAAFASSGSMAGSMVGASVGILARHGHAPALHSHVTGLLPTARHAGIGRALKLHQRAWAAARGIDWITWTFDPLVRRNAWFNIAVLGADVDAYVPSFYGEMTDAINAGDESDRLLMAWDVAAPIPTEPRQGADVADRILVPTPADIVQLRRDDPEAAAGWRLETRAALAGALDAGRRVVGFTRDGAYVMGSAP